MVREDDLSRRNTNTVQVVGHCAQDGGTSRPTQGRRRRIRHVRRRRVGRVRRGTHDHLQGRPPAGTVRGGMKARQSRAEWAASVHKFRGHVRRRVSTMISLVRRCLGRASSDSPWVSQKPFAKSCSASNASRSTREAWPSRKRSRRGRPRVIRCPAGSPTMALSCSTPIA